MRYLDPECKHCGLVHWQGAHFRPKVCIEALKAELVRTRNRVGAIQYRQRRCADLAIIVKDQQRHIANLEDQLLGYTKPQTGEQEVML